MKIALICSQGGHLIEMLCLIEAFKRQDLFFITYKNPTTEQLEYKRYLIENIGTSLSKMIKTFFQTFSILKKEKPDLIVSTGAEIAIPFYITAKLMRINTIYIESWCRVKTKSGTGRILYYISNVFLVQWPNMAKKYGKKAEYHGAVI